MSRYEPDLPVNLHAALKAGFGYFFANIVNKLSLFVLTLALARALSVESMGALSIFQVLFLITWTTMGLGAGSQVARLLSHSDYEDKSKYLDALLITITLVHIALAILIFLYASRFKVELIYFLLPLCSYAHCIYQIGLAWCRQTRKVSLYLLTELPCVTLSAIFSIFFIYVYEADWQARVLVMTISFLIFSFIPLSEIYKFRAVNLRVQKKYYFKIISLGTRLAAYLVIIAMIGYFDRLILAKMAGNTSAGIYSVYFQISLVVVLILQSILTTWTPSLYEALNNGTRDIEKITRSFKLFIGFGFITSIFCSAVWLLFIPWLLQEDYQSYSLIIIPLTFAQWLYCLHHAFSVFLINDGRPQILARNLFIICVFQCAINLALIPHFGVYAASFSFLITCLAMALSTAFSAKRSSSVGQSVIKCLITYPKSSH